MTFNEDARRGKHIELKVLNSIRNKYPCATLIDGYGGYDIWIPEARQGVEVKYDPMSNQTGNIVVEIEMSGYPSALFSTEADWWVFYDDYVYAWIKPRDIFKCIILNKLSYVEFTGSGDRNSKKAFLIDKRLLFTYAKTQKETVEDF
jgi:hypothetical protein